MNDKEVSSHRGTTGSYTGLKKFIEELNKVWKEVYRVLVPGGRLVVVVGDVLLPRRKHGRHMVIPLHADIQNSCMKIGFENLAPLYGIRSAMLAGKSLDLGVSWVSPINRMPSSRMISSIYSCSGNQDIERSVG